jgi:hypothetical protein
VAASREVLIRRVYRTGVQTVEREGDRYFLAITNRTYASVVEVAVETARRYYRALLDE